MEYKIRTIYAEDNEYLLTELTEEDKERYMELGKQTSLIEGFYDNPKNFELMWKVAFELGEINYSIFDTHGQYCGNMILRHPKETKPEIGIDLLKTKQNQGIAPRCIKMLARQVYRERDDMECILLRVSSLNPHSRHMIEKMGGVYDGEEETLMKRALSILDEEMEDEAKFKAKDAYEEYYAEHPEEEEEVVYRLMPEVAKEKNKRKVKKTCL